MNEHEPNMTDESLDQRLDALCARLATEAPPPRVDQAIERAIAARTARTARAAKAPPARRRWPELLPAWSVGVAAVVLVAIVGHGGWGEGDAPALGPVSVPADTRLRAGPFIPLVSLAELEAASDTLVVSTTIPRMQLSDLGVPVDPASAADAVAAEFLVGKDGAVLAVRFER